jgi:hypothetical protein
MDKVVIKGWVHVSQIFHVDRNNCGINSCGSCVRNSGGIMDDWTGMLRKIGCVRQTSMAVI